MTVDLWLVRHGQTDWNLAGRFQGQADPGLNETGRHQAALLAARLAGRPFDALYSSDLLRARETADRLADELGLPVHLDARLREVNHGEWDGLLRAEIEARFPQDWSERRRSPLTARPPGGETVLEVAERVQDVAADIARLHPRGEVLVVGHGLTLAVLACLSLCRPLAGVHERIPPNAEPTVVTWPPG